VAEAPAAVSDFTPAAEHPDRSAGQADSGPDEPEDDDGGETDEPVAEDPLAVALPGSVVTRANVAGVVQLLSPGVAWCVRHGMTMQIVSPRRVRWTKEYRRATNEHLGQTSLSADGRSLVGYVAGLPFRDLDPHDPNIAVKIMWNYEYGPWRADDQEWRNVTFEAGPIRTRKLQVERRVTFGRAARLAYTGRVYTEPRPELPKPESPNADGVRWKWSIHPILEPPDLKGVGITSIRYLSPDRQDDTWLYLPSLRRVKRLSGSERSDALFGLDMDPNSFGDDFGGFAANLSGYDWAFVGTREMLASMRSSDPPPAVCEGAADFVFCNTWERRQVYVIDAVAKYELSGKRRLFVDAETYRIVYSDIYDRSAQLWKVWVNQWDFDDAATVGMPAHPSASMVDVKEERATRLTLPARETPDSKDRSFNRGQVGQDFFTISHLIEAGY